MSVFSPNKKWYARSALVASIVVAFACLRGCSSSTTTVVAATDPQPDPKQPFANMNGAGCFLNRAGHHQPQLIIPPQADAATVSRTISEYVRQLITDETRQLSSAENIQQHIAGAITASTSAYNAAIASGASTSIANQAAMVSAAQYLHNQGVMGPLICPVALGFDNAGMTGTRVQ